MRPLIGIPSYWTQARWTYWDMPAAVLPAGYIEGVAAAGGMPVLLPPTDEGTAEPGPLLDPLGGLLLAGGPDLGIDTYGATERHPETNAKPERRDAFELALLAEARKRAMPVLGICRGMQLLNVASGGDLVQHLADVVDMEPHRPSPGVFGTHEVTIAAGSRAAALLGEHANVHSAHHQGVGRVGEGLEPSAHAPDGTVEALEDPGAPFCLGVLWHPEEQALDGGAPLFRGLVEAARTYIERGGTT